MTPAARVQAAIEIIDGVIDAATNNGPPADRLISNYFKTRRYAGSKDRRAVRELTYRAIRECGPVPASGRAAMLRVVQGDPEIAELITGEGHAPEPIADDELPADAGLAPEWLVEALAASGISGDEADALLDRAPLDVRVNSLKADRATLEFPVAGEELAAPCAVRFETGTQIEQWDAFKNGQIEVQDHGSQIACLAVEAKPDETVLDLCAGAGGKTLSLAAAMDNKGVLVASDTDRGRLQTLEPRMERAGADFIQPVLLNPGQELDRLEVMQGRCDAVLVDAPCSGTGTWRRNPEGRWRLTDAQLQQYVETQQHLLALAETMLKPGGRLIYVTCSLLDAEGADQIERFLAQRPAWTSDVPQLPAGQARGQGTRLTPFHDGTDGFFIARMTSPC